MNPETSPVDRYGTTSDLFWGRINKAGPLPATRPELGNCWLWTGQTLPSGYGHLYWDGSYPYAHRLAYGWAADLVLTSTDIVGHVCDTPACVRNDTEGTYEIKGVSLPRFGHLFLGTSADNIRDRDAKGRHWTPYGTENHSAKLTPSIVVEMRRLHAAGESYSSLARRFGMSIAAARRAANGETWKHVSQEVAS